MFTPETVGGWIRKTLGVFLGVAFGVTGWGADARFMAVTKGSLWRQEGPGAPVQQAGNAHEFRARVEMSRANALSLVTLKWPTPVNATRPLGAGLTAWETVEYYATRSALNNAHPNGTYTCVLLTALDGKRTNVMTVSADVYPYAPQVVNFDDAQRVDSRADFTLKWVGAGTGANGFVQVRVSDGDGVVFETPTYPQAVGALNGSASAAVIPRNTLNEGKIYTAQITIWRKVTEDLKGYPGVVAWSAYTQTTEFPVRTRFGTTDAYWYGFARTQHYVQGSEFPPVLRMEKPWGFVAFADGTGPGNLKRCTLGRENGAFLRSLAANGEAWRLWEWFGTAAELEAQFPAGVLSLSLETVHNGTGNFPLSLPAGNWPAAPEVRNFNEANAWDSSKPLVLNWNPLAGGLVTDFVQVRVVRNGVELWRSGNYPQASGALNGTSRSVTLPANLIAPGEGCEVSIFYLKIASRDVYAYPDVTGLAGYAVETTAMIRARGGVMSPPEIRGARGTAGMVELEFAADVGRQYVVEKTLDFLNWHNVTVTNAPGTSFLLRFPSGGERAFFRVLAN